MALTDAQRTVLEKRLESLIGIRGFWTAQDHAAYQKLFDFVDRLTERPKVKACITEAQRRVIAEQVARMFMPDSIQQEATDNILYEWGRGYRSPAILACVAAEAAMLAILNGEPEARPSEFEDEKTTSQLYQEW